MQAERLAPGTPTLLFEKANVLIETKRNYQEAKRLLELYLKAALTPDDPPRAEARKLLDRVAGA